MKKLILLIALFVGGAAAQNNEPILAYCATDQGCLFCKSEYSYGQIDGLLGYLGAYARDKGIMTFFTNKSGEQVHYPDTKRTPSELHKYFGGKGSISITNACPLLTDSIQPADGNWQIQTGHPQTTNCPKGLDEELKKVTMFKSGPKTFSKPFSPDDLLSATDVRWMQVGANRYRGIFSGAIGGFDTIYDVNVVSPDSIRGDLSFEVKIPGQPVCKVKKDFDYSRK